MKKFVFSMQKILDLRDFEKKQAQAELGKAVAEESRIQNALDVLARSRTANIKAMEGDTSLQAVNSLNSYLAFVEQKQEQLLQELTQAHMVTEQKREEMKDAMQKVRVLEKLKDARQAEWKDENKKAEAKEIDDIVTSRFAR